MFFDILLAGQLVWNIPLLFALLCITIGYGFFFIKLGVKANLKQQLLFFVATVLFYVTIGSPLSAFSHLSFSFHMIQMSILYFIVPPLLLLGIPNVFFQKLRKMPITQQLFPTPMISLVTFAILFLLYHIPFLLTFLTQNSLLHDAYLIILMWLALRMWWPITAPNFNKSDKKRFAFLSGLFLMPACLFFILSAFLSDMNNPLLSELTAHICSSTGANSFNLLPAPFNTKYDQFMAGLSMLGMHKMGLMMTIRFGK